MNMKKFFNRTFYTNIIIILFVVLIGPQSFSQMDEDQLVDGAIPQDWYESSIPQKSITYRKSFRGRISDAIKRKMNNGSVKNLENIVQTQVETLDSIKLIDQEQPIDDNLGIQKKKKNWNFVIFSTSLALSFNGILGVLLGRGASAIDLLWRRKDLKTKRPIIPPVIIEDTDPVIDEVVVDEVVDVEKDPVKVTPSTTLEAFQDQFQPIINNAISLKQVDNPQVFRTNLKNNLKDFFYHLKDMEKYFYVKDSEYFWFVNNIFFELNVSASGNIIPATMNLEGLIRLNFEWVPMTKISSINNLNSPSVHYINGPSVVNPMTTFLKTLVPEVENFAQNNKKKSDYFLRGVRVRFGISVSGKIFVAQAQMNTSGAVQLFRAKHPKGIKLTESNPKEISLSDDGNKNILIQNEAVPVNGENIIPLPIKNLRQGFQSAQNAVDFFASSKLNRQSDKWELFQLTPNFNISTSGRVGLVTVGGFTNLMLIFTLKPKPK
jgi:hypothetical protein